MSIVYDSFILEISIYISIRLHCYCGNNVKYGLFSKHLFQRKRQYGGWKKSHSNEKLLEKITSSSYHMEQKTSIGASCTYNIHTHWRKRFLQLLLLKVCGSFRFWQIKKFEVHFGLYESSLTDIGKGRPSKYCLCEVNLISYM